MLQTLASRRIGHQHAGKRPRDLNVHPFSNPKPVLGSIAMLDVKRFGSKVRREDAFSGKTRFRNEPFAYRAELAQAHRRYTSRYAKEVAELNFLIDALAPAGIIPDNISPVSHGKTPSPDFELTFGNERVFCECTSAGNAASMLWRFSVADLDVAANDMLEQHPELREKLGARYLALIPGTPIRPDDILSAVDEIAAFISSEDIDRYASRYGVRVPEAFRLLSGAQSVAYAAPSEEPMVLIQPPASAFGGEPEGVAEILSALRQKQEQRYDGFRPIWLVIGATDVIASLSGVIRQFEALQPVLAPFERVFIATFRESFMVSPKGSTDS